MHKPLFERAEILKIGRVLGALLVLFGGLALLIQAYFADIVPTRDGFLPTSAIVINLEQIGSFQSPSFLVTLAYHLAPNAENDEEVRSGQRVEFEQYYQLSIGDSVDIHYNPRNIEEWRLKMDGDDLSQYGLGALMVIFGAFSLTFPTLVSWASRREDFEFKDELDDKEFTGANAS